MKSICSLLIVAGLSLVSAHAKTVKLPNEDFAVASVNIPNDWEQEEITNGVAASSDDGAVYLSIVAVGSDKGMNAELDDTFEMLKEHEVELDDKSKKEHKFKINGLDAEELLYRGKDGDGPCTVSITFIPLKDKVLVLTYWVNTAEEKQHQEEVGKIVNSIKPNK